MTSNPCEATMIIAVQCPSAINPIDPIHPPTPLKSNKLSGGAIFGIIVLV